MSKIKFKAKYILYILILIFLVTFLYAQNPANAPTISGVAVNSISGYGHSYDNWTVTYTVTEADGDAVYNTTWFNTTTKKPLMILSFNANLSTTVRDVVNNYAGTAAASTWTASGSNGGAFVFGPVVNGRIVINNSDFATSNLLDNGVTVTAVVNRASLLTAYIAGQLTGTVSTNRYGLGSYYTGKFKWEIGTNQTAGFTCYSSVAYTDTNSWHYLVGVYNLTHAILYVDGLQACITATTGRINNTLGAGNFTIGGRMPPLSATAGFNGTIDEVQVYNYGWTPHQALNWYLNKTNQLPAQAIGIGENWQGNIISTDGLNYSAISITNPFTNSYTCTANASNANWILDLNEGCALTSSTNIGTGNLTIVAPLSPRWLIMTANLSLNQLSLCSGCNISLSTSNRIVVGQK